MLLPLVCGLVALTLPAETSRLARAGEVVGARHADRCEGRCSQRDCGKPGCPAHCPVRPDRFGFYGTQWRKWQGEGVVQASHAEAATPARPAKSEVPTADEESPVALEPQDSQREDDATGSEPEALPSGEPAASKTTAPLEQAAEPLDQPPREQSEPAAPELEPVPKEPEPAAKNPAAQKPAAPAADENLFDEASHQRRRSEALAKLQQQVIRSRQQRPEVRLRELARRQPLRPAPIDADSGIAGPASVRTVAHDEPSGRTALPPQRPNPLR